MAQIPSLDHAPVNLSALRYARIQVGNIADSPEQSQKELIQVLSSVRGKKVLILDPKLSGPLALIAQPTLLKENGVENLYHLSAESVPSECKNVIYLVRPRVGLMKLVSAQITQDNIQKLQKNYTLVFLPRRTIVCEKVLEEEGLLNSVTILEYPLHFIPFDEDVLSLELDMAFKETKVDGDLSAVWYLARAIMLLQAQFGVIPNIKGKGKAAAQVADILSRMQREQNPDATAAAVTPEIDTMILIDRQVDLVTPMCWQLNYEGLIDEFLTISNGAVELDPAIMGITQAGIKKAKVPLNSSDKLYRELRDLNFAVVGQVLRNKATSMKQDYNDVTGGGPQHQSVSELKDFVKKLNALPELTRHTNIAQHLSTFTTNSKFLTRLSIEQTLVEGQSYDISFEFVEEMIHRQEPLTSVLRLLALLSLTSGGLQKKHFDYLRREFLHTYGFEHMFTLSNLEKAGLFRKQEAKNSWQNLKRGFKLVVEEHDDANPTDICYIFSGYAPLSIRLVQQALKGGWKAVDELVRLLPGQSFEKKQGVSADQGVPSREGSIQSLQSREGSIHGLPSREGSIREGSVTSDSAPADGRRAVVLVVFIGGVTYAEISALRFLGAQEGMKYDFVVATTKLINGTTLLKSMVEES